MTNQAGLLKIVEREREDDVLPFFQRVDDNAKKELTAYLKTLCKEYLEFRENKNFGAITFKRKATDKQAAVLTLAAFMCFNRKDFENTANVWSIDPAKIDAILEWYCPSWFGQYINAFGEEDFTPRFLSYDWVITLAAKGYLVPTKDLIVKTLPEALFEQTKDQKYVMKPENLLRHSVTLSEHIWYFFDTDNNVYLSDRYLYLDTGSKNSENRWISVLREFSAAGRIDRQRLLKESILGTTRNFNKLLSGWYADLFETLEPSAAELLEIQPAVLSALNVSHSKPVNVALAAIKKIAGQEGFDVDGFVDAVPLLLTSETKSIVTSAVSILEKIAKSYPERRQDIAVALCQVFVISDDTIQTRVSKIISRYAAPSETISEAIARYKDSLLVNARKNLEHLFTAEVSAGVEVPAVALVVPDAPLTPIETSDTFDELLFLASQAFDNNKPYHVDLLPALLVRLDHTVRGENISKLEPALQRAFKLVMDGWTGSIGYLDQLLAIFFIDYCNALVRKYPEDSASLKLLYDTYRKKDEDNRKQWPSWYSHRIVRLVEWKTQNRDTLYEAHKNLLLLALGKIQREERLPLLSTPTHEPAFLSAATLVERLVQYERAQQRPDSTDLEIAISRAKVLPATEADAIVKELGAGEVRDLLSFHLLGEAFGNREVTFKNAWLAAAALKSGDIPDAVRSAITSAPLSTFTGQYPWRSYDETYQGSRYDAAKRKYVKTDNIRKKLNVELDGAGVASGSGGVKDFFSRLLKKTVVAPLGLGTSNAVYESLRLRGQFLLAETNDMARILYLIPNNPEPMLAQLVARALRYNTFADAGDQKLVVNTIEALVPLDVKYKEMGHLFMAMCMLCSDKTIQSFAAELWIKNVVVKNVDSKWLGQIIGTHEAIEFAPLRRFTDLLGSHLMNVSPDHNRELELMLSAILLKMPQEPVTNLKKLLETYFELVSINHSDVADDLKRHVGVWRSSASLKKVVSAILER